MHRELTHHFKSQFGVQVESLLVVLGVLNFHSGQAGCNWPPVKVNAAKITPLGTLTTAEEWGQMRLNKSAPVGILPLMQVQVMPRTPCAHCQHEAGSLLCRLFYISLVKNYNSLNYKIKSSFSLIQGPLLLQLLPPRTDPAQAACATPDSSWLCWCARSLAGAWPGQDLISRNKVGA